MKERLGFRPSPIERGYLGLVALAGFLSVVSVSMAQWTDGGACPLLGPIPACYLVFVAYGTVVLLVVHPVLWSARVFWACWSVLFGLAALGSGFELAGHDTCPKTENGIPKCFFSLALASSLIVPFLLRYAAPWKRL